MRTALIGVLVGAGFMLAIAQAHGEFVYSQSVYSQTRFKPTQYTPPQKTQTQHSPAKPELITHFAPSIDGPHTMAIVDPQRKVLAVYHIDANSGATSLKSVRNLSWDLQMIQFNSETPSPQDIRSGLEQQ